MSVAARQRPSPGTLVLDHVSHFVPDLQLATQALEALGFAVTPASAQKTQDGPAGTSNVCVMLEEGYLEFLAPTSDTPNAQRLRATMQSYPGVHLACFGTPAAEEEHARLGWHGFEPQPLVNLERAVEFAGNSTIARFKVVRAAPGTMPEGRIQFVEHLTPDALWQPRHLEHSNSVTRLACVFVVAEDAVQAGARWARFAALLPRRAANFVHLETARGDVLIAARRDWKAMLGDVPAAPALAGYALECGDPKDLASRFKRLGMSPQQLRDNLYCVTLPGALGGAWVFGTRDALDFPTRTT
jgi:hypothetical protein